MKKMLAILLMLAMVFSLAACGSTEKPAEEAAKPEETPADTQEETGEAKPFEGTTLRVILATHDWTSAVEKKLSEFEEATGMKVEYEVYPEGQLSAYFLKHIALNT